MPGFFLRVSSALASTLVMLAAPDALALEPSAALPLHPDPVHLALGVRSGFGQRLGDTSTLPIASRLGGTIGMSASVLPSPDYALGLTYEHGELGSDRWSAAGVADVDVQRTLDLIWATVRIHFVRTDRVLVLAQLGPGLAFEHVDTTVLAYPLGQRPDFSRCGANSGPGFGLRVGLGVEARVVGPLWFTVDSVFDALRLGSEPLDTCAPGAGTTSVIGARMGFAYRIDVSRYVR